MCFQEETRCQRCQRQLADDQRAVLANEVREMRARLSVRDQRKKARRGAIKSNGEAKSTSPSKDRTRSAVAKSSKLPERKLRLAQEVKKAAPELVDRVRAGRLTLVEAKKIARLEGGKGLARANSFGNGCQKRSARAIALRQEPGS